MTVSSTIRAVSFIGNGGAAQFAFAFKVFTASDLLVTVTTASTGAIATLALATDYSVALNADQNTSPGGSITLLAGPLATGYWLEITSAMPMTQLTSLANAGGFYPSVINDALDRLTILVQQLATVVKAGLIPQTCAVTVPGTVYTASGNGRVSTVFVNGQMAPVSAYSAPGLVITFNYTLAPGDEVDALCTII